MSYKILLPLLLLFFAQCKDREMVGLSYAETLCADPWECDCRQTDNELIQAIEDFLNENTSGNFSDIELVTPQISFIYSPDCSTLSGTTITIQVLERDIPEYLAIGFLEN